ncbi:bifunctional DNA primase/polymerase [Enterococcus avium]|uniref:bifunctional DNA primase/polymerase n=1 Tax=Enterococcus avium TaxID=33945 RepID=UPI001C1004DF|nr:bifunctional DNA primase/polymerase [Enterococcus avium]MBU5369603.1 bifunctional DNA primase/polymerase [Enterococcus avium]MDT2422082.1 bifunctional DNA primase/polymerase [Enterococcus avium]
MIESALWYVEHGLSVLPLQANEKAPMTTEVFPSGFKSATTDKKKIQQHWSKYPTSNIGLRISENLIVMDIDVHNENGFDSLAVLEREFDKLPDTFSLDTPTGGKHYYFRLPEGVAIARQINAFKGIDLLTNGYVVASPSSINDKKYTVSSGSIDKLAYLPNWLLRTFETHQEQDSSDYMSQTNTRQYKPVKKYTGALLDELVAGATVGGRNDWIMRMTSKMLSVGAELDTIYRLLLVVNDNFLTESLPLSEINATFKSRVKKHTRGA